MSEDRCVYCGIREDDMLTLSEYPDCKGLTNDHKIPKSDGGSDKKENLVKACYKCNQIKNHTLTYEQMLEIGPKYTAIWWRKRAVRRMKKIKEEVERIRNLEFYEEIKNEVI